MSSNALIAFNCALAAIVVTVLGVVLFANFREGSAEQAKLAEQCVTANHTWLYGSCIK